MPVGGNPSQPTMYQNSTGIRQQAYYNQANMRPSGYQISQPQPSQGLYTQPQIMFMPQQQYSSTVQQVMMPMTTSNYPPRMSSPAYQNSMPTTQPGLFQLPQQNTANFTPHAHPHTYNNPPAVFYNAVQQQNRPPSASGMSGPGQQPAKKRERIVLQIIDLNSGKDIMQEVQQARGTPPSSSTLGSSGTVSGQEISHIPQNEIVAQFAAQVAQVGLSTCPGGNQQRIVSDAEDIKKDGRGRKKEKDINRKGEMRQGSEMDAFMDSHTKSEASTSITENEDQDQNSTKAETSHKMFATTGLQSPHMETEDGWIRSSSEEEELKSKNKAQDPSLTAKIEKNKKQNSAHTFKRKKDSKKKYDRKFLLKLQNAPQSMMKPADLPDIPDIIIKKSRNSHHGKDAPRRGINLEKNIGLSMQKDTSLHPLDGSRKSPRVDEEQKKKSSKSEDSTLRAKRENQKQKTTKAEAHDKKVGTVGKPSTHVDGEKNWSSSSLEEHVAKLDNQAQVASHTEKTKKNKKQKAVLKSKEEQCSPIIPEVKKRYDRMFLLKLQNAPQSMMKPTGLPDIPEIMIEKPSFQLFPRDFTDVGNIADFTTRYVWTVKSQLTRKGGTGQLGWFRGSIEDRCRSQERERTHLSINRFSALSKAHKTDDKDSHRDRQRGFGRPGLQVTCALEESEREKSTKAAKTVVAEGQFHETRYRHEPEHAKTMEKPSTPFLLDHVTNQMDSRTHAITDKCLQQDATLSDSEKFQLGTQDGAAKLDWFEGCTGAGARYQDGERPNTPGKRFSALSRADKSEDDGSHRGGRLGRFGQPGPQANHPSQELQTEIDITAAKTIVAARLSEEESGWHKFEWKKTMKKPSTPVQELTDDQMGSKTRAIMDEYLHKQDVGEVISCIKELSSSGSLHLLVYHALNHVLERSEADRRQTGLLLHDLVKNNVLLVDTYVRGLNEVLMYAEDMEIEIPKIWEFLGQLIGPMVQDGSMPLSFLKQVCEPLRANGKSGILVAEILHDASHREGHKKVARLWAESGLHWSDFIPNDQIDQFLTDKKLEFIKVLTNLSTSMSITDIKESLHSLILSCSNEEVFDWIEGNVNKPMTKDKDFIHALMSAVCRSAIAVDGNNMMKVDKSQIQRRNNLLRKYLDHQMDFELQALYALQALVHKLEHPPGMLRELFDILYDEDIIPEDAFIQWEKSEDPQEQEGKSMALKQVVQFFTWLKEAEDEVQISNQGKDGSLWYISQNKNENLAIQKDNNLNQVEDDAKKSPQEIEKEGAEEEERKAELQKIEPQNSHQDNGGSGQSTKLENNEILSIQKDTNLNHVKDGARKSTQEEAKGDEVEVEVEEDQKNEASYPSQTNIQSPSYPSQPSIQPPRYSSLPSIQPPSYPSSPSIQPTSYPSSPSIQPPSYPSHLSIQPPSCPIPPSIQSPSYPSQPSIQPSYSSQPSMQPPSYPVVYPQPGQGMYISPQHMITPQQMLSMPQAHYSSTGTQVRMPLSGYPNHLNMQPTSYLMGQPFQVYAAPQQRTTSPQQQMIMPQHLVHQMTTPQHQQITTPQHQQMTAQQYQNMTTPQQQQMTTPQQMMFMPQAQYNSVGTQVKMPMNKCLPRKDDNNQPDDQINGKEVQEEQNCILMLPGLLPDKSQEENTVEGPDEQSVQSHLSSDNGQRVIQSQEPSSSRKSSVKSPEWDVMQLEKEKLKLEIEFIKVKYKKIIEETEVLKLQKELLKLQINHFS